MANPYLDALDKKILPRIEEIRADGKVTAMELWQSKGIVFEAVTSIMAEAAVFDENDKVYLIDAFNQLWDRYIKPTDIAWIPNWIEDQLKSLAKSAILSELIKYIDDQIKSGVVGSALPPAEG